MAHSSFNRSTNIKRMTLIGHTNLKKERQRELLCKSETEPKYIAVFVVVSDI